MAAITLRAPAKINLSLRVSADRGDGFHEVRTILQTIDLFDRVSCEARRGPFRIRCTAPGVPTDRTNLVWKAAQQLWRAAGRAGEPRDAVVTLEKRIPMQAGLGGGSSDAAAALVGLRRIWRLPTSRAALHAAAAQVGSDVPYFLLGGTALGLGRGDEVYPLPNLPPLAVVLVLPPFGVATGDAYRWFDAWPVKVRPTGVRHGGAGAFPEWLPLIGPLVNDLEGPVAARHPAIGQAAARLRALGAVMAAMSGSGSAVFGLFGSAAAAGRAARELAHTGAEVRRARFLGRKRP